MRRSAAIFDLNSLKQEIVEWVASALNIRPDELDVNKPFSELGLDSLDAVHLFATIESTVQQELPEDIIRRVRSLRDIFEMPEWQQAASRFDKEKGNRGQSTYSLR